ncbi:unnamed protein product [Dibothriocephalus latus]|uniref:Uncharacterized protein n=1 Tax=Dibothriocephalus latus TaxID=60516 RepID=A0A3P7N9K2_DIBLA|nr:unnamed protein product [Dibothriocephalus latus]
MTEQPATLLQLLLAHKLRPTLDLLGTAPSIKSTYAAATVLGLASSDDWLPAYTSPSCPMHIRALHVFHTNAQVTQLARLSSLKCLQFNAYGQLGKLDQLLAFMRSHSIAVAVIPERKWSNFTKVPSCADYTIVCRDRCRNKGGGLAFFVDKYIAYHQLAPLGAALTEVLVISPDTGPAALTVVSVYIPPTSSCPPRFTASIAPYLLSRELWCSNLAADPRVEVLSNGLEDARFAGLNENSQTRPPTNGASSSSNVSLASLRLVANTEPSTKISLGSD